MRDLSGEFKHALVTNLLETESAHGKGYDPQGRQRLRERPDKDNYETRPDPLTIIL